MTCNARTRDYNNIVVPTYFYDELIKNIINLKKKWALIFHSNNCPFKKFNILWRSIVSIEIILFTEFD